MQLWQQVTTFVNANSAALLIGALGAGLAAAVLSVIVLRKMSVLLRPLKAIPTDPGDARAILPAVFMKLQDAEAGLAEMVSRFEAHVRENRSHLKYVGLVRFNAFEDIAGQQSYSMCLLDGARNGVLMTYLTGKNSARSYAVAVENGNALRKLSDEEVRAMDQALTGETASQPEGVTVTPS